MFLARKAKQAWRFTSENVIPKTDEECRFALARSIEEQRLVCTPEPLCEFRYKARRGRFCRFYAPHHSWSGWVRDVTAFGATRGRLLTCLWLQQPVLHGLRWVIYLLGRTRTSVVVHSRVSWITQLVGALRAR